MPIFARLLNVLFPPQCLNCNAQVTAAGTLCLTCWQQVRFISEPCCACCGLPFDYAIGAQALCGGCMQRLPAFAQARAVLRYDDASRRLVLKLKYQDQTHVVPAYGQWMAQAGRALIAQCDVIVPVPLHYWRLIGRRYNQSAILARAVAQHCQLPVWPTGLQRTRATTPQAGLTHKQRQDNVKGAFAVRTRLARAIKGKSVLLIDDVLTTGATVNQCAACLLKAGAVQVYVLTLARRD